MTKPRKLGRYLLIAFGSLVACGILAVALPKAPAQPDAVPPPTATSRAPVATVPPTRAPFPSATTRATWTVTDTPEPANTLASRGTGLEVPTSAPAKIVIDQACSQPDPAGDDNRVLADEFICFVNRGDAPVDLKGWLVHDEGRNSEYTFRALTLAPGATVKLHTGKNSNGPEDVYWGKNQAVWNNDGDTVYLYDATGAMVDQWKY